MITIDAIKQAVCEEYKVDIDCIMSQQRRQRVARPRQVAMYLAANMTGHSLSEIGWQFTKDRTTITHAIKAIERHLQRDVYFQRRVNGIVERLGGPPDFSAILEERKAIDEARSVARSCIQAFEVSLLKLAESNPREVLNRVALAFGYERMDKFSKTATKEKNDVYGS